MVGLTVFPVTAGFGSGDLPDLGGEHFSRIESPRVAMAMRGSVDAYDYGSIWHLLDHRLHLPHSQLNMDLPVGTDRVGVDLPRYNVLILPAGWFGDYAVAWIGPIREWVKTGGTLIAIGSGTNPCTRSESKLSQVRRLEDVLDDLDEYELTIWRQWMARQEIMPEMSSICSHRVATETSFPWTTYGGVRPALEERKRRDAWQRLFMPAGTIVAGRVDREHWLTFGCDEPLPLMIRRGPVLMSKERVETPVRLGFLVSSEADHSAGRRTKSNSEMKETIRAGWALTPPENDIYLRMSGLLWPEATHRLANAAYLTGETAGDGQVILFADSPNFRASTLGSARLLMNAIVYGPGLGAKQPIRP